MAKKHVFRTHVMGIGQVKTTVEAGGRAVVSVDHQAVQTGLLATEIGAAWEGVSRNKRRKGAPRRINRVEILTGDGEKHVFRRGHGWYIQPAS